MVSTARTQMDKMISMWHAKHQASEHVSLLPKEHQSGQAEVFDAHASLRRECVAVSSSSGTIRNLRDTSTT